MRYLLDTHTLLWFLRGDARLSAHARELMNNYRSALFFSTASLWEMAIKVSLGKLDLDPSFEGMFPEELENNGIGILDVTIEHLRAVCYLPFHHRDPFDRLIIAQAQVEKLPVISADTMFDAYGIKREW